MYKYIENNFKNRYKVLSKLGKGGMGSVYLAVSNDRLEHKRAIKEISFDMTVGKDVLQEAFIMKELEHEGIPRIVEIKECIDLGRIYIVQEYIEGVTLDDILKKDKKIKDIIVYDWAKQLADVLKYIHGKNIIHRDIKLENIMLTSDGKIKLIDFGIASNIEGVKKIAYTANFASPEQIRNDSIDGLSDVYSMGVVLCVLLTGEFPKLAKDLKVFEYLPDLNPEKYMPGLVKIIKKAVVPSKSKRYKSSEKLLYDIEHIHRLTSAYKKAKRLKRLKVATALILIVGGYFLMSRGEEQMEIEKSDKYYALCSSAYDIFQSSGDEVSMDEFLNEAESLYPDRIKVHEIKAEYLLKNRDYDSFFEYAGYIERNFDIRSNGKLNYLIGTAYFEREDYDKAVKYLERSYEDNHYDEKYARDYAVSLVRSDSLDKAEEILNELKMNKNLEASTYYVSGEYYNRLNDVDTALDYFNKCKEASHEEELTKKTYLSMADVYRYKGDLISESEVKRIQVIEEGLEVVKNNNLILEEMLGEAYFDYADIQSDWKLKEEYFDKAYGKFELLIESGYERKYIYDNLVAIEKKLGNYYDAEELIVAMKGKYPEDASVQIQLIWIYLMEENLKNNLDRDYANVISAFNDLNTSYNDVEEKSDYIQIKQLMFELVDKNWIDREDLNI
jgi:serine/threonine-protein kinase